MFKSSGNKTSAPPEENNNNNANNSNNNNNGDINSRFSLVELKRIHLQLLENKIINNDNKNLVIEILRVLAEMVVYGDNKSELLFDFFCEKNMLSLFLEIMWGNESNTTPLTVHVQILQTLSILISSVKNDTSLYYLLSNNHINDIIHFPFALEQDESLQAQYASFIKTLSLRLNEQTVQFFFIEETGAFPLLTKSIQLLKFNDPMIRISAQTAILNVYQVKDDRARAYALQEEVLHVLFNAMIELMKNQLYSLQTISESYITVGNDTTATTAANTAASNTNGSASSSATPAVDVITKLEQSFEDLIITIEDWLYYLQDMYDLNIITLQRCLLVSLMNNFIIPDIIHPILPTVHGEGENQKNTTSTVANLEINGRGDDNDEKKVNHYNVNYHKDNITTALAEQRCVIRLFYLLQISRIFSAPFAKFSFLVALLHPLSSESRAMIITHVRKVKNNSNDDTTEPASTEISDETTKALIRRNPVRSFLSLLSESPSQRTIVLLLSCVASLVTSLRDSHYFDSPEVGSDLTTMLQALDFLPFVCDKKDGNGVSESVMQSMEVLLDDVVVEKSFEVEDTSTPANERKWRKSRGRNLPVRSTSELSPDLLPPSAVKALDTLTRHQLTGNKTYFEYLSTILKRQNLYSLVALQIAAHQIWILFNAASPSSALEMFNEIRDVSRLAATTLHSLVDSQFTDIMLMLINEEMKRYEGRKWKVQFPKLLGNKLLLFPTAVTMMSASLTSSSFSSSLGIDFSIPISQIESLRKNIQLFLLIRALFHSMNQRINKEGSSNNNDEVVYISDDFCSNGFIDDRTFLCLEESNLIPAIYQVNNEGNSNNTNSKSATTSGNSKGGLFDMKGKKFLDCSTSLASALTNSPSSTSTASTSDLMSDDSSTSSSSSIWSTSASVLSMGLIGGNKKAANIISTKPINSPSNPRKQSLTGKGGNSNSSGNNGELKLLFVQDPMLLILVTQSRVDGKSVFKIFLIVPLLYCDAKVDLNNKCKFKLVVRSWKNQVNMTKHESEFMIEGVNNNGNGSASDHSNNGKGLFGFGNGNINNNSAQRRGVETFLKNVEKSSLYYLNICMETEQACSLAVQHIESRRKLLTNHKLDKLKNILHAWMDEAPVPSE